MIKLEAN